MLVCFMFTFTQKFLFQLSCVYVESRLRIKVLLGIKKLESEKLQKQFEDQKRQLDAKNQSLNEDITKLLSHRDDLINQMETMYEQMGEFSKDRICAVRVPVRLLMYNFVC